MRNFKDIKNIDRSILDRISEDDVTMWIAARLQQIREKLPEASSLGVSIHNFKFCGADNLQADWNLHAADKCSGTSSDIGTALETVIEELLDNPRKRASEARRKAKQLLDDAAQLESISSRETVPAHGSESSPQTGLAR